MGSLGTGNTLIDAQTESNDINMLKVKNFDSFLNSLNLKDLEIPAKNGFKRDIITDSVYDASKKIISEDVSDYGHSIVELGTTDVTTDVAQDSSGSLSEMLPPLALNLCHSDLKVNGEIAHDDSGDQGLVSLADYYFGGGKQSAKDKESIDGGNSLADLLGSFTTTDLGVCTIENSLLENNLLNSLCIEDFGNDSEVALDKSDGVCTRKIVVEDVSDGDHSIVELSASDATADISQDSSDSLSEMLRSLTLDIGHNDSMVNGEFSHDDNGDRGMMSLVDYYLGKGKQSAEGKESSDEENSLVDLLGSLARKDSGVSTMGNCLLENITLNSLSIDGFKEGSEVSFVKSCEGMENLDVVDGDKTNFSLADLYYNGRSVEWELSDKHRQRDTQITSDNIDISTLSSTIDSELSDNEKFSICEDDFIDECDNVDLCSALKPIDSMCQGYHHTNLRNYTPLKNKELVKERTSLFCKVLSAKLKKRDLSKVPKHTSNLYELVGEMDYNKYFSFDSPSPDDVVREKQKNALI